MRPRFIGSEIYRRSTYGGRHPLAIPRVSTCIDLCRALGWLTQANYIDSPRATPEQLARFHDPDYIAAIVQRAGGAERLEGLEPLDYEMLISGADTAGFIAERDGPDLVAFAFGDPAAHTRFLEQYIDLHAANEDVAPEERAGRHDEPGPD